MQKTKSFIIFLSLLLVFMTIIFRVLYLINDKGTYYQEKLNEKTVKYVEGLNAPRGRIMDINGNVIVDNKLINIIVYNKLSGIIKSMEIDIAYHLASLIDIDVVGSKDDLITFYLLINEDASNNLIKDSEKKLLKERKITKEELNNLKRERVLMRDLETLNEMDKKASYYYALMNKGVSYYPKIVASNVSNDIVALINEEKIMGITTEVSFERIYNYETSINDIMGRVGSITPETKSYYLEKNYALNDIVGISYLEEEYEEYLRGTKAKYKVNKDNSLTLVKSMTRGSDLVLSIDMDIQLMLESIQKKEMANAKKKVSAKYFTDNMMIISDSKTSDIVAISGLRITKINNANEYDSITSKIINTSYTGGSIVKGASMALGYKEKVIDIGNTVIDGCVKLYLVPSKCSHKSLGKINDVEALKYSSNYYQFLIAIGITGNKYSKNMKLNATEEHFLKYRNIFKEFGLGTITNIDLPNESVGIMGKKISDDLLLNLSIGQYDTYTPIMYLTYMNTIINNGNRYAPSLMKRIVNNDEVILENKKEILNKVDLDIKYFERIKTGFSFVATSGTARGYINKLYKPAGKTGTSETGYDSNNDKIVDMISITSTSAMYFPSDNPKYTIVSISPNISYQDSNEKKYPINYYLNRQISDFLFDK